jgi:hypothetical protein
MKKYLSMQALAVTAMAAAILTGCGVETATTAATAAQIKAEEAKRAQEQLEAVKKEIEAAQQLMQQRIEEADRNATNASPVVAP